MFRLWRSSAVTMLKKEVIWPNIYLSICFNCYVIAHQLPHPYCIKCAICHYRTVSVQQTNHLPESISWKSLYCAYVTYVCICRVCIIAIILYALAGTESSCQHFPATSLLSVWLLYISMLYHAQFIVCVYTYSHIQWDQLTLCTNSRLPHLLLCTH